MSTTPLPPVQPTPQRLSTHWVGIVLALLAIIVLSCIIVLWAGLRFVSRNVHVSVQDRGKGKEAVSISTPVGAISVNADEQVSEARLGLPVYPGATQVHDDDSATVNLGILGKRNMGIVVAKFQTADPIDKVRSFYQERLGSQVTKLTWQNSEGETVFEIKHKDDERVVTLKSERGGTGIELVHVGARSEQTN